MQQRQPLKGAFGRCTRWGATRGLAFARHCLTLLILSSIGASAGCEDQPGVADVSVEDARRGGGSGDISDMRGQPDNPAIRDSEGPTDPDLSDARLDVREMSSDGDAAWEPELDEGVDLVDLEAPDLVEPGPCVAVPSELRLEAPTICSGAPADWTQPYHVPDFGGFDDLEQAVWRASQDSGVVCIGPGEWYVSDDVTVLDGVRLVGAGRSQTRVVSPRQSFVMGSNSGLAAMTLSDTMIYLRRTEGVTLSALDLLGDGPGGGSLEIRFSTGVVVRDVRVIPIIGYGLAVSESTAEIRDSLIMGGSYLEGDSDPSRGGHSIEVTGSVLIASPDRDVNIEGSRLTNAVVLGRACTDGLLEIRNSIMAGPVRAECGSTDHNGLCSDFVWSDDARSTIRHSVVSHIYGSLVDSGLVELESVTDRVPRFYDPDTGDYRLCEGSFAVDGGDPAIFDLDGTRSDLGAYGGPGVGPLITPRVEE